MWSRVCLAILALGVLSSTPVMAADAERGRALFEKCAGCHQVGDGARAAVGPPLTGIVGRPAASTDFSHSPVLAAAGGAGLVWDEAALDALLIDPSGVVPGTRMRTKGVEAAEDRADLIAFLASYDGPVLGFVVPEKAWSTPGDPAYGEYLAGECSGCHGAGVQDIPDIAGMDRDRLVSTLHAYRAKARRHPVMEMIAGRLDDEQIASLSEWLASQKNN